MFKEHAATVGLLMNNLHLTEPPRNLFYATSKGQLVKLNVFHQLFVTRILLMDFVFTRLMVAFFVFANFMLVLLTLMGLVSMAFVLVLLTLSAFVLTFNTLVDLVLASGTRL